MDAGTTSGLEERLDVIIRLLAAPMVQGKATAEAAPLLSQLGIDNNLIAKLCKTSPTVVRTAIRRKQRPKAKGGSKPKAKKPSQ